MRTNLTKRIVSSLLKLRYGYEDETADYVAEGFLEDEIPNNNIKTVSGFLMLLDYIDSLRNQQGLA